MKQIVSQGNAMGLITHFIYKLLVKGLLRLPYTMYFKDNKNNLYLFSRYDSLTGVPSSQRTVAFEKASVLFNIGGLYTQIGTRQDRGTEAGLDAAVDNFLRYQFVNVYLFYFRFAY